jgi:hypothetical protein
MTFDDWLLALHVLTAAAFVAGVIVFWVLLALARQSDTAEETIRLGPLMGVGSATVAIGSTGTVIFGIWLAFSVDSYDIWDGWIIAAIVLWAIATEAGRRADAAYRPAIEKARELFAAGQRASNAELLALNRNQTVVIMHSLASVLVLLILVDMIVKPGA